MMQSKKISHSQIANYFEFFQRSQFALEHMQNRAFVLFERVTNFFRLILVYIKIRVRTCLSCIELFNLDFCFREF